MPAIKSQHLCEYVVGLAARGRLASALRMIDNRNITDLMVWEHLRGRIRNGDQDEGVHALAKAMADDFARRNYCWLPCLHAIPGYDTCDCEKAYGKRTA